MVSRPEHHRWSSVHANLGLIKDPLVTPHPVFLAQDPDPQKRSLAYQARLHEGVSDDDLARIRAHLQQERALGDVKFQAMVVARPSYGAVEGPDDKTIRMALNSLRPLCGGAWPSSRCAVRAGRHQFDVVCQRVVALQAHGVNMDRLHPTPRHGGEKLVRGEPVNAVYPRLNGTEAIKPI